MVALDVASKATYTQVPVHPALQECLGRILAAEAALSAARESLLTALKSDLPSGADTPPGGRGSHGPTCGTSPADPEGGSARKAKEDGCGGDRVAAAGPAAEPTKLLEDGLGLLDQAVVSCVGDKGDRPSGPRHTLTRRKSLLPARVQYWRGRCCRVPVIHPDNKKLLWWNVVGILFITYLAFMIPYDLSFGSADSQVLFYMNSVVDTYYILDVVLGFFTGYEDDDTKEVVMDPRRIARRYLKFWFYMDFVMAIPWDWVNTQKMPWLQSSKALRAMRIGRIARVVRLVRLGIIGNSLEVIMEEHPSLTFVFGVIKVLLCLVSVTHWAACAWYFIGSSNETDDSWVDKHLDKEHMGPSQQYVYSLYFTLTTMTTVGYGDIVAQNFTEVCFVLFLLLLASVVFATLMGELTDLIRALNMESQKVRQDKHKLAAYVKWRRVPRELALPLRTHLVWLWETQAGFDTYEEDIKQQLSPVLKQELSYHVYGTVLRQAPFLQWLRLYEPCLKELSSMLSSGFLSPGDRIFRKGDPHDQIFILLSGWVRLSMNDHLHQQPVLMEGSAGVVDSTKGPGHVAQSFQEMGSMVNEKARQAELGVKYISRWVGHTRWVGSSKSLETQEPLTPRETDSQSPSFRAGLIRGGGGAKDFAFKTDVFSYATKSLREYEARLSWSARLIQNAYKKRKRSIRGLVDEAKKRHGSSMRSKPICAPAYFGEACLWLPSSEWDTTEPDKFTYSASCESQVEVVYIKRTVIKEILDRFSPWLPERFEIFREAVVRVLPISQTKARQEAAQQAAEESEEEHEAVARMAAAASAFSATASISTADRLRRLLNCGGPEKAAVDWNYIWNHQAWNMYPGERLVNCAAHGSATRGTIRMVHASSVNAEWDGSGSYEEDTIQVQFVNGYKLSGSLHCGRNETTIRWTNGMVWTLVQTLQESAPPIFPDASIARLRQPLLGQ